MKRTQSNAVITFVPKGKNMPAKKKRRISMAQQIGAVAKIGVTPEWKDYTTTTTIVGAGVGTWSPLTFISQITQSVGAGGRIGRKCTLKSLLGRFSVNVTSSALRLLVVYDHSPNGVLPAITDIITTNDVNGVNNLNNSDRFLILKDFYPYSMVPLNVAIAESFFKSMGAGLQQVWSGTGGTIADITTGAIYIAGCAAASAATATVTTRVRYTDV